MNFEVKKETKPVVLNSMRITNEMNQRLLTLCHANALPMHEIVRQMIQFALDHMKETQPPEKDGEM